MNPFGHLNDSLSASRIGTYLRCPLRYYFDRLEKRPWERISGAILLGAAVDRAAKEAVLLLKQGREGLDDAELEEIFDRLFRVEVGSARAPIAWGSRFDEESAKVMGRALLKQLAPVLLTKERLDRITGIDVPFTIPLVDEKGEPLMDTPLVGVLDFVEETAEGPVPLELKTASNRTQYLPDNLSRDVQALIYGLAAKMLRGDGPAKVKYLSAVKLKTPEVIESENEVSEEQLRWVRGVVTGVKRAIDGGVFVATPSTMECGPCPFREACSMSRGVGRQTPRRLFDTETPRAPEPTRLGRPHCG